MKTPPAWLDRFFALTQNASNVRTELVAGMTTFLTLLYIVFVNPAILASAGLDQQSVYVATCLAAAFGCFVMGLYANYPIALAPGMGLNAYFASAVVVGMGVPWQTALGAVFVSGVLFLVLSALPIRHWLINSIPSSQKIAISAGIGMFLALLALQSVGIVADHPATLLTGGELMRWTVLLVLIGFVAMVAFDLRKTPGAIALLILAIAIIGWVTGWSAAPTQVFSPVPSLEPTFLQLEILSALELGLITIIFSLLLVDLFDTSGTLVAVLDQAKLLDSERKVGRLRQALIADSSATIVGALLGTSTTTSYIESAAGIRAGGRTGLTAVTVGVLFLIALFFAPLALSIPAYATAPAILLVGCVMITSLKTIDWDDLTEFLPAIVTAIMIPFTFSIATGIGIGFICYVLIKALTGRVKETHPAMAIIGLAFLLKFAISQ